MPVPPEQSLARAAGSFHITERSVRLFPPSHCWLLCNVSSSFLGNWISQYCPGTRISPMLVLSGTGHFSGQWDSTVGTMPAWCPVLPHHTYAQIPSNPTCDFFKTTLFPSWLHSVSSVDMAPPVHLFLHKCFFRCLLVFH